MQAHQSEFHVPQSSVYSIAANFPGPLHNLFRVGKKPLKSYMSFEDYYIADEPLLQPVGEVPGFFELVDPIDAQHAGAASMGMNRRHMNDIEKVEEVKAKPNMLGWFVGQVMKATQGKANPQAVNQLLRDRLGLD